MIPHVAKLEWAHEKVELAFVTQAERHSIQIQRMKEEVKVDVKWTFILEMRPTFSLVKGSSLHVKV